jgi:cytochrome c oxidase subunit III
MQGSIDQKSIQISGAAEEHLAHSGHGGGHEEHPDLRVFGLMMFLIAEGALFIGLFVAYLTFRAVTPIWPPEGTPKLELLLPGINTVVLIASSLVIHQADAAIKKNDVAKVVCHHRINGHHVLGWPGLRIPPSGIWVTD